jgi:hypothetical protein
MDIDREDIGWAFACKVCMPDMSDEQILDICERHKDIFSIDNNEVKFTKEFLNEATKVDRVS